MKAGIIIDKSGIYCCLYHLKKKQKFTKGTALPPCNFAGLRCAGEWHLLKEIKEKTREEMIAANLHRKSLLDKKRGRLKKEFKMPNKWDFEKW